VKGNYEYRKLEEVFDLLVRIRRFPEAGQCDTALAISRRFASEVGMKWLGGLALGQGGAIEGKPLTEAGGKARNARKALDLAADALANDLPIPEETVSLMAKPIVPRLFYNMLINRMWKKRAKRFGAEPVA